MRFSGRLAQGVTGVAAGVALALAATLPAAATTVPRLWTTMLPVTGHNVTGNATVVSPDGSTVYAAGTAVGTSNEGYGVTAAFSATTGAQIWKATLDPGQLYDDGLSSIAVSPSGATVFVTGFSGKVGAQGLLQIVLAYSASSGTLLWQASGPVVNSALSPIAVSPDSSTVYVTSPAAGASQTVAYNATTGAVVWSDPVGGSASAVAANGTRLFITGQSGNGTGAAFTEAINTATGAQVWNESYGTDANFTAAALNPGGSTLFVGGIDQPGSGGVYATVAYSVTAGKQKWAVTAPSDDATSTLAGLAETSTGSAVVAVESVVQTVSGVLASHWQTVAYSPATGATLWAKGYIDYVGNPYGGTTATAVAANPVTSVVYVTGYAEDGSDNTYWVVKAYKAGKQMWTARYEGRTDNDVYAIAVNPAGTQVVMTGNSAYTGTGQNGVMATTSFATKPS